MIVRFSPSDEERRAQQEFRTAQERARTVSAQEEAEVKAERRRRAEMSPAQRVALRMAEAGLKQNEIAPLSATQRAARKNSDDDIAASMIPQLDRPGKDNQAPAPYRVIGSLHKNRKPT